MLTLKKKIYLTIITYVIVHEIFNQTTRFNHKLTINQQNN